LLFPQIDYNAKTLSFLTDYRPNFCSDCGEKIVRLRWRVWTSRRFCGKCFTRIGRRLLWRHVGISLVVLFSVMLIGRGLKREAPPLVIERTVSGQTAPANQPTVIAEETYICGARTKKGTPCSRRVRGPVRCWQHKGAKAMLPQEKLVVKE
jgi:hypothetical protein